jgi:hypothetical protein
MVESIKDILKMVYYKDKVDILIKINNGLMDFLKKVNWQIQINIIMRSIYEIYYLYYYY